MKWIRTLRIGFLHAAYHRNMRRAELTIPSKDIEQFKRYVYRAEDAWRKLVVLQERNKK